MREINYRSDFDFVLRLRDCADPEKTVPFPACDWNAVFWTSSKANCYTASYRDGVYTNCLRTEDGGIRFIFDNHRMGLGTLKWEPHFELPNVLYPDGLQDIFSRAGLDIELVDGPGDCPTTEEIEVIAPFIKGDKGDAFTYADFTAQDKADLITPIKDDIDKAIEQKQDKLTVSEDFKLSDNHLSLTEEARRKVFDDMWLAAVGTHGSIDHTHYDDADADGNRRHTPYYLNTLWLTYGEAVGIYTHSVPTPNTLVCAFTDPPHYRTNLVRNSSAGWLFSLNRAFLRNKVIEVAMVGGGPVTNLEYAFYECTGLRRIIGNIDLAGMGISGAVFPYCRCLEEFRFERLGASAELASCRAVSLESLRYLISKRYNSNTITITVHPDVYAKITDETNAEWYALLDLAAQKNVNIATTE